MRRFGLFVALSMAWLRANESAVAGPLDDWQWRYPSPQGNNLYGITYGGGRFVAVGAYETIISSPEGTNWSLVRVGGPTNLQSVAWGNGVYVAVGNQGLVMTSTDGESWARRKPFDRDLFSVDFGNGLFVAVGGSGTNLIATSSDGVNWALRVPPVERGWLKDVKWAGDYFVAVGGQQSMRSRDGITWESNRLSGYVFDLEGVGYGDGRYVATGQYTIFSSTDVTNWVTASNFVGHYNSDVAYGNGRFVIVGNSGIAGHSTNGQNWVGSFGGVGPQLADIVFANGRFVAVGESGTIVTSTTGTNWLGFGSGPQAFARDIAGTQTGAALNDDYGIIRLSSDLMNWYIVRTNTWVNRLTFLNGRFIGVGRGAVTLSTSTWNVWTNMAPPTTNYLWDVAFGNETYVVSGYAGTILTSPDAVSWTVQQTGTTNDIGRVAYQNGRFLTLNNNGDVGLSTNGVEWTFHSAAPLASGSTKLAAGNGVFVAVATSGTVGEMGTARTSRDGLTWSRHILATNVLVTGVTFANGIFLVTGQTGGASRGAVVFDSRDGTNWTRRSITNLEAAFACGSVGKTFVVSGWRGVLLQSGVFPSVWVDRRTFPQFILDGHPGTYRIEGADDMRADATWDVVVEPTIRWPARQWVGPIPTNSTRRFYRAVLP